MATDYARNFLSTPVIQPGSGWERGRQTAIKNALAERAMADRERRTDLYSRQLGQADRAQDLKNEQFEIQKGMMDFKYLQLKAGVVGDYANRIRRIPDQKIRQEKYAKMYEILGSTVRNDPVFGELGNADMSLFLTPEEFSKLSDKEQDEYVNTISMSGTDFAKLRLEDRKTQSAIAVINARLAANTIIANHKSDLAFKLAKYEADLKNNGLTPEMRRSLEFLKIIKPDADIKDMTLLMTLGKGDPNLKSVLDQNMQAMKDWHEAARQIGAVIGIKGLEPDDKAGGDVGGDVGGDESKNYMLYDDEVYGTR